MFWIIKLITFAILGAIISILPFVDGHNLLRLLLSRTENKIEIMNTTKLPCFAKVFPFIPI